jgi:hypothetical protein
LIEKIFKKLYKKDKKTKKKSTKPTLKSMIAIYKKKGFKRPIGRARAYMAGFNTAKKYRVR